MSCGDHRGGDVVRGRHRGYRRSMRVKGSVVVVTGASSGIGRATALALARRGAHVVLVARNAEALEDVAVRCGEVGPAALVAPADTSDPDEVEAVADTAVEARGRIDAWVNAASVTMFGALTEVPLEDVRRVLDVNVMGYVHGCRSALPRMIAQRRGVVVNVSSILGVIALPHGSAYTMSKFAIRGLSASLRQELRLGRVAGVDVCTVLPAAIDTPIFANAANHSGRRVRAVPPVYAPERVARIVVNQIRFPRREVVAGGVLGRMFVLQHRVLPGSAERLLAQDVDRFCLSRDESAPATSGNLYAPAIARAAVHGGWHGAHRERRRRWAGLGAVAAALLTAGTVHRVRSRSASRVRTATDHRRLLSPV